MGQRGRTELTCRACRAATLVLVALGTWAVLFVTIGSTHARSAIRSRASSSCGASSTSVFGFGGGTVISNTNVSVCATGQVEVSFTGNPSPGCAGGPCRYIGTDVWQPQGGGDLDISTDRVHGRRQLAATFVVGSSDTVQSAVERVGPDGTTTACSDTSNGQGGGFFSPAVRGGRLVLSLARAAPPLVGTRCAGPLAVDLRAALPTASISLRRIMQGGGVIDLGSDRPFAAHGFSGVVRSTLVLHLGRAKETHGPTVSTGSPLGPGRGHPIRQVSVTYHLERLVGNAVADVRTSSDFGECGPFDACGLSGGITIAPLAARGGSLTLAAGASTARPRRDLLAALGLSETGNATGIGVFGGGDERLRGTVTADLNQGSPCRDQAGVSGASVLLQSQAGRLLVSLSLQSLQAVDPLRTRCPGPELGQHALALSTLPRGALHRRVVTVALHGNEFSDGPYRVRTRSTLMLTLRRVRVAVHTFRVPSPPSSTAAPALSRPADRHRARTRRPAGR